MTGYGRATCEYAGKNISVEIRSVNSKNLDMKLKLPNAYKANDLEVRRLIGNEMERGKIDISIDIQYITGESHLINHTLFAAYSRELTLLCAKHQIDPQDMLRSILTLPNILETNQDEGEEEEWKQVQQTLHEAIAHFNTFRKDEGAILQADFSLRNALILQYLHDLTPFETERITRLRARLEKNIQDWASGHIKHFDENRLEQEMLFYIEKMDITEEKTRLRQHCDYFMQVLADDTDVLSKGRKLEFISQEIGREVNTIGSKANHAELQRYVVMMKDELEKIKEQLNNVL